MLLEFENESKQFTILSASQAKDVSPFPETIREEEKHSNI